MGFAKNRILDDLAHRIARIDSWATDRHAAAKSAHESAKARFVRLVGEDNPALLRVVGQKLSVPESQQRGPCRVVRVQGLAMTWLVHENTRDLGVNQRTCQGFEELPEQRDACLAIAKPAEGAFVPRMNDLACVDFGPCRQMMRLQDASSHIRELAERAQPMRL
jgi:hypothetical protein